MIVKDFSAQLIIPIKLELSDLFEQCQVEDRDSVLKNIEKYFSMELTFVNADQIHIIDSSTLGFSFYTGRTKQDKFLEITSNGYCLELEFGEQKIVFTVVERIIYFDYGLCFLESFFYIKDREYIGLVVENLEYFHEVLIGLKENNEIAFLKGICNCTNNKFIVSGSFSISFFVKILPITCGEEFTSLYKISDKFCGEYQSSKNESEFRRSGINGVYINHGFTGSFYVLHTDIDRNIVNNVIGMNSFLQFVLNIVSELIFFVNDQIIQNKKVKKTAINQLKQEYQLLILIRDNIESLLFDICPQNVSTSKLEASIYTRAIESSGFHEYTSILVNQKDRLTTTIAEIANTLQSNRSKKVSFFLKVLSLLTATSVFSDIFSYIGLNLGYYFLFIPLVITLFSILMLRTDT